MTVEGAECGFKYAPNTPYKLLNGVNYLQEFNWKHLILLVYRESFDTRFDYFVVDEVLRLFSTLCDNFCLCKVKCLLGKTFRTTLKEETITIDLVSTQKPEEPFCRLAKILNCLFIVI